MRVLLVLALVVVLALLPSGAGAATFHNTAELPAADPHVLHDEASGFYYVYSTDGADPDFHYGIYRSADLVTWEKVPGGALRKDDPGQWGNDWFWAPEVYANPRTGLYFLFYAARSDANKQRWFGYAEFEEPSKMGVAVARSPEGPFRNIGDGPLEWFPYDPDYHDVNLLMGPDQKRPPATLEAGRTAPRGTYIPTIDPNVFFAPDGRKYLYASRNAYRNWNWDATLGKYVEESDIIAVPLDDAWWDDPAGRTLPRIRASHRGTNAGPGGPLGPRRDGYEQILSYGAEPQGWENANVDDFALSGGERKDRRWEEGSTTWAQTYRDADGRRRTAYYLTYSANNWETAAYGVGYAVADSPLGPWRKAPDNPILSQRPRLGLYSTGHGDLEASPDGRELYYVHHGRPSADAEQRRLYTSRLRIDRRRRVFGKPSLRIDATTRDRPVPSGVEPYALSASPGRVAVEVGARAGLRAAVATADGTPVALASRSNRVAAAVADPGVARVVLRGGGALTVVGVRPGTTTLRLTYQRRRARGGFAAAGAAASVRVRVAER